MKTAYIAYSMTNGTPSHNWIDSLIPWLGENGYNIIQPSPGLFPDIIASKALESIEKTDIVVGDVTIYSHGVGFELGYAYALKKEVIVICYALARNKVSKFIKGLFPDIIYYYEEEDLLQMIEYRLDSLQNDSETVRQINF